MTREDVIEILERFVLGAKPCSQKEIIDACASAYRMLKEQPSLPSDLDEAAEKSSQKRYSPVLNGSGNDICYPKRSVFKQGFKAGAKWLAGQEIKIGETKIYLEDDGDEPPYSQEWLDLESTEFKLPDGAFQPGDEVEVILRKKQ